MSIETEIKGSPASIRAAAAWLGDTLRPAVESGGDAFVGARREASSEWRGETGDAFVGAMGRAVPQADNVVDAVSAVEGCFQDYAGTLERCQSRMSGIRDTAAGQGLTVSGFVIQPPGAAPPHPGNPPQEASQGQVDAYNSSVSAWNQHQDLVRAYNDAATRAEEVWLDIEEAWDRVSDKDRALDGPSWTFNLTSVAGGLAGAVASINGSILRESSKYFDDLAAQNLDRLRSLSRVPNAAQFYDDLDHYARVGAGAADDAARAGRLLRVGRAVPLAVGGVMTGVGIWYDMEHNDESAAQAVASNVGSFGASVAAGALVGTAIGGPVGTVAGVIVGAGVGVFTSGMIDGLWDSGGDIGEAAMAGLDTLADTGGALLDGASDVGGAIVDGIGGLFD